MAKWSHPAKEYGKAAAEHVRGTGGSQQQAQETGARVTEQVRANGGR